MTTPAKPVEQKYPCRISASRHRDVVFVEMVDSNSRITIVELELSAEELGRAFFGSGGNGTVEITTRLDLCGKVREHKNELVWVPERKSWGPQGRDSPENIKIIEKALLPFCVDGWNPRSADDVWNMHNRRPGDPPPKFKGKGDWYEVVFIRYVDPPPELKDTPR